MGLRDKPKYYMREINTLRLCENELDYISKSNNLEKHEVIAILRSQNRLTREEILKIRYSGGDLYGQTPKKIQSG